MEVFTQRLEQEFNAQVVVTAPSVPYKIRLKAEQARKKAELEIIVANPAEWPEKLVVAEYREPVVLGTILAPAIYLSNIMALCNDKRGEQRSVENIDQTRLNIQYLFPLNEIVTNFFDELKSVTSGYASFDYEDAGYQPADLHRLEVRLNGSVVQELSTICHASKIRERAKAVVFRLKTELPRQQFAIAIQAASCSTFHYFAAVVSTHSHFLRSWSNNF